MNSDFTRILPLSFFSQSLTIVQAQYHPSDQELLAQLFSRRKFRREFGIIPAIGYSDHQNVVRLVYVPADRITPSKFRWFMEVTMDGSEIRPMSGRTAIMNVADGFSRNPEDKLARLKERSSDLRAIKAMLRGFEAALLDRDDEDYPEDDGKPLTLAEEAALQAWVFSFKTKYDVVGKLEYAKD